MSRDAYAYFVIGQKFDRAEILKPAVDEDGNPIESPFFAKEPVDYTLTKALEDMPDGYAFVEQTDNHPCEVVIFGWTMYAAPLRSFYGNVGRRMEEVKAHFKELGCFNSDTFGVHLVMHESW